MSLALTALALPVGGVLFAFIEGWGRLGVIVWTMMFMAATALVSLLTGIGPARTRRVALAWVIPLWWFFVSMSSGWIYGLLFPHYLRGQWPAVAGYSALIGILITSVLLMPYFLAFPANVKKILYRSVAVLAAVFLIIALPDMLF